MPDYRLFGGYLRSELEFPELAPTSADPPNWTLCRRTELPEHPGLSRLGTEDVDAGVTVTLFRAGTSLRLAFDDTGVFDISPDGRRIDWVAPTAPDMDAVRKDILGRVLAVALDQAGVTTLHGSAVAINGVAVAFLAPKFHGKSTTATALVNAGGRLLADDLVPVTGGDVPMVLPSVPVVQLWADSAARVGGEAAPATPEQVAPKRQVVWKDVNRNAEAAVPLAAVYVLAPVKSESGVLVTRTRLSGVQAALALLGQAKVGALLGVERRSALLDRLVALGERISVYRLEIPRDFDRIGELTSSLIGLACRQHLSHCGRRHGMSQVMALGTLAGGPAGHPADSVVSPRGQPIVRVEELVKTYPLRRPWADTIRHPLRREQVEVLRGVSLQIERGEFFGLLGPNGAGKTTLFKILATLVLPDSGWIEVGGHDVRSAPAAVRRLLTPVIADERSLYWRLSAIQNLNLFAALYDVGTQERERTCRAPARGGGAHARGEPDGGHLLVRHEAAPPHRPCAPLQAGRVAARRTDPQPGSGERPGFPEVPAGGNRRAPGMHGTPGHPRRR